MNVIMEHLIENSNDGVRRPARKGKETVPVKGVENFAGKIMEAEEGDGCPKNSGFAEIHHGLSGP